MTEFKPIKEGKVREIYDNGDSLIMVATDRISAFDVILKNKVTNKGKVLTQMSKFWFDYTRDLLPNHMLSVDVKEMPEFFQQPQYEGRSMMCRKLTMLPVECIVRGYITGSGWASYQKTGKVCGIQLPDMIVVRHQPRMPEVFRYFQPGQPFLSGKNRFQCSELSFISHFGKEKGDSYSPKDAKMIFFSFITEFIIF